MNKKIFRAIIIIMMIICTASNATIAQNPFTMQNLTSNYWGTTDFIALLHPPQAIGIGNFASPTQPLSALHINTNLVTNPFYGFGEVFRTDCPAVTVSEPATAWRMFVNGTEIGNFNFNYYFPTDFNIQNPSVGGDLVFQAKGTAFDPYERMRITDGTCPPLGWSSVTRVSINYCGPAPYPSITSPQAMLHLGFATPTSSGWRNWMDIGTFMGSAPPISDDFMYVGLDQVSSNTYGNDAVIAWGDDECLGNLTPRVNTHYLRFLSIGPLGTGPNPCYSNDPTRGIEGLETMRITPDGKVGVGDFTATTDPQNTLEIIAPLPLCAPSSVGGTGNSGLSFRKLTSGCSPGTNPGNGVLSVSSTGEVVYVYDNGTAGGVGFGYCTAATPLTSDAGIKFQNNSIYFDDQGNGGTKNNIGIGYGCSTPLTNAKVDVLRGNFLPQVTDPFGLRVINNDVGIINCTPWPYCYNNSYGIYSLTDGINSRNYSGTFVSSNGALNMGINAQATGGA